MILPPIETYETRDGLSEYYVVRDDIPFPFPSPNFSKIRGLETHMKMLNEMNIQNVAIQDTIISRCGWGTAYVAKKYGMKVYNFYSKRPNGADFYRKMSQSFGATTIPVMGTHQRIAVNLDKAWLKENKIDEYTFLPIGINLPETIDEHIKIIPKLPSKLFEGTVVVCVSSGTIISGILAGIKECNYTPDIKGVQIHNWKNREQLISDKVYESTGNIIKKKNNNKSLFGNYAYLNFVVVDAGFTYHQTVNERPPFPCDQYLDRKAWHYIEQFHETLKKPITLWNIGGEWNPETGIGKNLRGDGSVTNAQISKHFEENGIEW